MVPTNRSSGRRRTPIESARSDVLFSSYPQGFARPNASRAAVIRVPCDAPSGVFTKLGGENKRQNSEFAIEIAFLRLWRLVRFLVSVFLCQTSRSRRTKGVPSPALTLISVSQALLVGEYLSFRRVATVLGVRQSAVSRRVRELEDELGVSLFERHHAGVRITNAGVRFLQEARAALLQLDQAVKTATAAGSGTIGRIEYWHSVIDSDRLS